MPIVPPPSGMIHASARPGRGFGGVPRIFSNRGEEETMTEIDRLAEDVAHRLVERKESIAVAESAAGGRISAALLGVAGASAYFKGGVVVYTGEGKQRLAGMTLAQLESHRS